MVLGVEKLRKKFGDRTVLSGVYLEIDRGTVLALCGPSVAGKTTLIRILGGLIGFDDGRIALGDRSVTARDAYPPGCFIHLLLLRRQPPPASQYGFLLDLQSSM